MSADVNAVTDYYQLIWPYATKVGCGLANSVNNYYYVCHYDSPWNIVSQYRFNTVEIRNYCVDIIIESRFEPEEIDAYAELHVQIENTGIRGLDEDLIASAQAHAEYLANNS